jgi:rSAM/selenodomain-associated transferase 1
VIDIQLLVLAKTPVPGRVKTRLCPPLTPEQAAGVAAAALADTLATVERVEVRRRAVVLDGDPAGIVPAGFSVIAQRGNGLDERLAAAFEDAGRSSDLPILLVGMDTPQMTPLQLAHAAAVLAGGRAVLGHAEDGGWWALGLERADAQVFLGVPMSSDVTGREQEVRMRKRGLSPVLLPVLRDIDHLDDLLAAADRMPPTSRVASVVRDLHDLVPA